MINKIYFYNTFNPVVPIYKYLFKTVEKNGLCPCAIISAVKYRDEKKYEFIAGTVNIPRLFSGNKRFVSIYYFCFAMIKIFLCRDSCLNVFLTQPPMFYVVGVFISSILKVPCIIHVMDLYPALLFQTRFFKHFSILKNFFSWVSRMAYNKASKVIVIGRDMEYLLLRNGVDKSKIVVINNWCDDNVEDSGVCGLSFRKFYGYDDNFIVLYSGNMGNFHCFETIIKCIKRLKNYNNIKFVFCGYGKKKREIEQVSLMYDSVKVLPYQDADLYRAMMASCDINFISMLNQYEGMLVPSKFYGALYAGVPVMFEGPEKSEIARVINESDCGLVIQQGDVERMCDFILRLYNDSSLVQYYGKNAKRVYSEKYSSDISVKKYLQIIENIIKVS